MYIEINHIGIWIAACLVLFLIGSYIMSRQGTRFFSGRRRKKFSMFELEFPSSPEELSEVLAGIDLVPVSPSLPGPGEIKKALRGQLLVDFLFMPATYGAIFFLCMASAYRVDGILKSFFVFLGWLQVIPWIGDIAENIFLLKMLDRPAVPGKTIFRTYQWLEAFKWGISLLGLFLALGALAYCWLIGATMEDPMHFH